MGSREKVEAVEGSVATHCTTLDSGALEMTKTSHMKYDETGGW